MKASFEKENKFKCACNRDKALQDVNDALKIKFATSTFVERKV